METCSLASVLLIAAASAASAQDCDMTHVATHPDPAGTRILSSETGVPALYFHADMDVNTDAAARSYHPDDPRGQTKALNSIANPISRIFDATGNDITCG